MPAPPLPPDKIAEILRVYAECGSFEQAANRLGLSRGTVRKYVQKADPGTQATTPIVRTVRTRFYHAGKHQPNPFPDSEPTVRLPDPAPEAGGPGLPEPWSKPLTPFDLGVTGWVLVLGDTHFPMHDRATIEAAVNEARAKNVAGVLLNGDIMDMMGVSPFFRPPSRDRLIDEIEVARQFLQWLRSRLPNARICYRSGNHEFRLVRYICERAGALADLPSLELPKLLDMDGLGIEWVTDKRKVTLGKLITLHGHELRKGEGVNPARLAFLRTTCSVLVGHHHRTSEHHQRGLDDKHFATWSVGCACFTGADYDPYNQWNHGYAMVEVGADGWFSVHNRRVLNGRVV